MASSAASLIVLSLTTRFLNSRGYLASILLRLKPGNVLGFCNALFLAMTGLVEEAVACISSSLLESEVESSELLVKLLSEESLLWESSWTCPLGEGGLWENSSKKVNASSLSVRRCGEVGFPVPFCCCLNLGCKSAPLSAF